MGIASRRSSPLPWGTPSIMSMRTTSASSLEAIQWAAVAPTLPEPTIVTFLRMISSFVDENILNTEDTEFHRARHYTLSVYPVLLSVRCVLTHLSCLRQHARAHVLDD